MLVRIIAIALLAFCLLMLALAFLQWAADVKSGRTPVREVTLRSEPPAMYVLVAASRNPRARFEDYTRGER